MDRHAGMLRTPQHELKRKIHQRTDAYRHVSATPNFGSTPRRTTGRSVAVVGRNGIHAEVIAGDGRTALFGKRWIST